MVTRGKILTSFIYKFAELLASEGVAFVVGVILARLLSPEDYGVIGILMIFISIAQKFVDGGFGKSLIQKEHVNDVDYSSVFYATIAVASIFYALIFFTAPYIAAFYKMPQLKMYMRYLALVLLPYSYNSIQSAKITKEMRFKKLMFTSIGANLISGITGIAMAYNGFGIWSLIAQQITAGVASCVLMSFVSNWRPRLTISFTRLKILFSFGGKMLASSILDTVYKNLQGIIIGKRYTANDLGFYNRGMQYPQLGANAINGTLMSVMFPAFSLEQGNRERIKEMVRRTVIMSSFVVFPAMAGLAATARPLVAVMLSEKWLPCVPYLMISCGIFAFYPIHTVNLQAIAAMGRSDIFLKLELIKKGYGLIVLAIAVMCFDSPMAIMLGSLCSVPIGISVNAFPNKRLLGYSILEQLIDILPCLLCSLVMGAAVYCVTFFGLGYALTLLIQIPVGVALYFGGVYLAKLDALKYVLRFTSKMR